MSPVWIVPLWLEEKIAGFAAFIIDGYGAPEDAPILEGVFDSIDEATTALAAKGVFGAEE